LAVLGLGLVTACDGGVERGATKSSEGSVVTASSRMEEVPWGPDFIVTGVTAPAAAYPYATFTARVTVCNQGTAGGEASVGLFLSADAEVSPADRQFAGDFIGLLEPGQCATRELSGWLEAPSEEPFSLGAIVAPEDWRPEVNESNNTYVHGLLGIGVEADFIVTDVTAPANGRPGEAFNASVTVCNQGTAPGQTDVELMLATGPEEPGGPTIAGAYFGWIDMGQCSTQDVFVSPGFVDEGTWYLRAITNRGGFQPELIHSNNDRVSNAFLLQY
jgi:hypothetical protein